MKKTKENALIEDSFISSKKGKLLYSIVAILLVVGLMPLIISSLFQIKKNEEKIKTAVQENQLDTALSLAEEIELYLKLSTQKVKQLAETLSFNASTNGLAKTVEKIVETEFLDEYLGEDILYLQVTDLEGKGPARSLLDIGNEETIVEELIIALSLCAEGQLYLGDPVFLKSTKSAAFVIAFPLVVNNKIEGFFFGILSLNKVWDAIEKRAVSRGFTVYAIDNNGILFAHSERSEVSRQFNFLENPLCKEFMENKGVSMNREFMVSDKGEVVNVLGACAAAQYSDKRWGVFVHVRSSEAFQIIIEMKRLAFITTLVAATLAILIGIIFAHRVTKPLNQLTETTKMISKGDFSKRVNIRTTNEVGQLADTFNKMADDIGTYVTRLKKASERNIELFEGSIKSIAAAVDAKDPYTQGHSDRVTAYSVEIARSMGLSAEEIKNIRLAAMLHDVGKIGISDSVLSKKGALTDEEFEEMKKHPEKGAQIMSPIDALRDIIPGLRYHHERYGGGGYPTGIAGEDIPLMARVISVADTFDAMTTKRPYQNPMTPEFAVSKIYELRKSKYDEKVVEAFIMAYRRGNIKIF